MSKYFFFSVIIFLLCCTSNEINTKYYTIDRVIKKDSLIYFLNDTALFTGKIVEKDSLERIKKEINYSYGLKNGKEIHYEYFESDLAIVVLEGSWKDGKKSGIWKSRDGEGQITIIKEYE